MSRKKPCAPPQIIHLALTASGLIDRQIEPLSRLFFKNDFMVDQIHSFELGLDYLLASEYVDQ